MPERFLGMTDGTLRRVKDIILIVSAVSGLLAWLSFVGDIPKRLCVLEKRAEAYDGFKEEQTKEHGNLNVRLEGMAKDISWIVARLK